MTDWSHGGGRSRVGNYEVIAHVAETALGTLSVGRALVGDERGRLALLRRLQRGHPLGDSDLAGVREAAIRALRIHDGGVLAVLELLPVEDGLVIVSEYIEGLPLRAVLEAARKRGAPLPGPVAVRLGTDLVRAVLGAKRALAEATVLEPLVGLTPDGVLLASSGDVMISGLGLAMLARPIDLPALLAYRSPEHFSGAVPDERSEVYSVGVLLWELLAGKNPLAETPVHDRATLLHRIRTVGLPRLDRAASSSLSPAVAELVMQAVARDPAHRIPNLATLSNALTALGKSNSARTVELLKAVEPLMAPRLEQLRGALDAAQQLSKAPESGPNESVRPTFRPPAPVAPKAARAIGLAAFPRAPAAPVVPRVDTGNLSVESARQVDSLMAAPASAAQGAPPQVAHSPTTGLTRTGLGPQGEADRRQVEAAVAGLRDLAVRPAPDPEPPASVSQPAWSHPAGRTSPLPADDVSALNADAMRPRSGRRLVLAFVVLLVLGGSAAIGMVALKRMQQQTASNPDPLPGLPTPSLGVGDPAAAGGGSGPAATPEGEGQRAAAAARQRYRPQYRPRFPVGAVGGRGADAAPPPAAEPAPSAAPPPPVAPGSALPPPPATDQPTKALDENPY